jgi:hypothetical protein
MLDASIVRAMSEPRTYKQVEIQEQAGQGRSLAPTKYLDLNSNKKINLASNSV